MEPRPDLCPSWLTRRLAEQVCDVARPLIGRKERDYEPLAAQPIFHLGQWETVAQMLDGSSGCISAPASPSRVSSSKHSILNLTYRDVLRDAYRDARIFAVPGNASLSE
jgi:hypothetical protein